MIAQVFPQNMANGPRITVVIGTCNRKALFERCLALVRGEGYDFVSIVVIDAGSTDGTREYLQTQTDVQVVLEKERNGQAWALNRAADQAKTDYLCWLSDDNVIRPGALRHAVQVLDQDSSIGLVSLKVKDVTGPSAHLPFIGTVGTTGVLNCNQGVLRTSVFRELGGFDENLRDYFIDNDLTTRVLLAGLDVVFSKKIAIDHFRHHEGDSWIGGKERKERIARNKRLYEARYEKLLLHSVWSAMQGSFLRRHLSPERHPLRSFHAKFTEEVPSEEREWGCEVFSEFIETHKKERDREAGVCLRQHISERLLEFQAPQADSSFGCGTEGGQMEFLNEARQLRQILQYRLETLERVCAGFGPIPTEKSARDRQIEEIEVLDLKLRQASLWSARLFLGKTLTKWWVRYILTRTQRRSREMTISVTPKRLFKLAQYISDEGALRRKLIPKITRRARELKINLADRA